MCHLGGAGRLGKREIATVRKPSIQGKSFVLEGVTVTADALPAGLYVTATPIGNLGDVTIRALRTLAGADLIACEDTRVTARLTERYGIATPRIAYHEHNAERQRPKILAELGDGKSVALVSDAGTPLVSDPGYRLVTEAIAAGHDVIPLPGASAMLAGLVGAGLPTDSFFFAGFLPPKEAARRKRLAELAAVPSTLLFYEAPQRVATTLADMADAFGGERPAAVARELTKKFETFRRGTLAALAEQFANEPPPKGEITIVVGPPPETAADPDAIDEKLRERMATQSLADAVAEIVAETGATRNEVYRRALAIKDEGDGD
jgi:16S rRNA (cytidine1402-2'-O)-methyltransferase